MDQVKLFQQFCVKYVNKRVKEYFKDLNDDNSELINTDNARKVAREVCLHKEPDPITLTVGKLILFSIVLGDGLESVFSSGEVREEKGVKRAGTPKLTLFFKEDRQDVEAGYPPVKGEISFRLMGSEVPNTKAELEVLAKKIKQELSPNNGYVWRKGKDLVTYTHWEKGYQLQLLCRDKTAGKNLITKILSIKGDTPQWEYMNHKQNEAPAEAFPTVPPMKTILGKQYRYTRRRPIADVRYQYAELKMPGIAKPIVLHDRAGFKNGAIVYG